MPVSIRKLTAHPDVAAVDGTANVLAVDSETVKANERHTREHYGLPVPANQFHG